MHCRLGIGPGVRRPGELSALLGPWLDLSEDVRVGNVPRELEEISGFE
jgi:hypothetical protein